MKPTKRERVTGANEKAKTTSIPVKAILKKPGERKNVKKNGKLRLSKFQENLIYMMGQFKTIQRGSIELSFDFRGTVMRFKMNKTQ